MTTAREISKRIQRRNVIINGNFDVWQRGNNFASVAGGTVTTDRWKWQQSGSGVVDVDRSFNTPDEGSEYTLATAPTTADASIAAGDYYYLEYSVEGYDAQRFGYGSSNAKNATLSFLVRSSVTGIHSVAFRNQAGNRSYIGEYTINVADTWEYKSITIPGDTSGTWEKTTGQGITVTFAIAMGSTFTTSPGSWTSGNYIGSTNQVNGMSSTSNNYRFSRVQLEIGSSATNFEYRNITEEIALCQRYYCKTFGVNVAPGSAIGQGNGALAGRMTGANWVTSWWYPVEMRSGPTITYYNPNSGATGTGYSWEATANVSVNNNGSTTTKGFTYVLSGTVGHYLSVHATADAEF